MHRLKGSCHCGNILVDLELPKTPHSYAPRACDCDFCRKHDAAYVSDPQGSVVVWIGDGSLRGSYRQGSGQVEFLSCSNCGVLIGAFYSNGGQLYAAVNTRSVRGENIFAAEQKVSPRLLSADEKTARWRSMWFGNVSIVAGEHWRSRT